MTRFYLLRHGETAWNAADNRYCGRTDVPLSATGQAQAEAVAQSLAGLAPAAVVCSPLKRSRETATIIAAPHSLEVRVESRMFEIDFGGWEGKTRAEIERDDPVGWRSWTGDPTQTHAGGTGETGQAVANRFASLVTDLATEYGEATVILVGHNTLNRLWILASLGAPLAHYRRIVQHNTGISVFELGVDGPKWQHINASDHLGPISPLVAR